MTFDHRHLQVVLLISLGSLLFSAGCDQASSAPGTSARLAEVRLGYFANVTHGQAVLGVASGDFERAIAPREAEHAGFNAGPALIEALFAGEIDIGYIGPGPAITAHAKSKGQGIRIIAGAAANGVAIVARKDSGITALADLAGKRIATPQLGNTQDIAARHYLTSVLKQPDAKNILPIANAEQATMMARGEIDAAWAPEPWAARLIADGGLLIGEERDLWPDKQFSLTLVAASPDFLSRHPAVVEKLLSVHLKWTKRLQTEPKSQAAPLGEAIFALTSKRLPLPVIEQALTRVSFIDDPLPQTLSTMSQWTYELGFLKDPSPIDGLIDLSLLEKARTASANSN